jgi:hypothetical protein
MESETGTPISDVEADEALGRCAPSGLRSLTPVVMPTINPDARSRRRAAQNNIRQIAGGAVTRGRAVRELRVSAPGEAADATDCRAELVARPLSRSMRSGRSCLAALLATPKAAVLFVTGRWTRHQRTPGDVARLLRHKCLGIGRAMRLGLSGRPCLAALLAAPKAADCRNLWPCARGCSIPRADRFVRAENQAKRLILGFRLRPGRVWAHRVRCATVLECVRSRPGTSRAP